MVRSCPASILYKSIAYIGSKFGVKHEAKFNFQKDVESTGAVGPGGTV